jgi:hypothetical protein
VWNRAFDPDCIPYQQNPNRMFNAGAAWSGHLADTRDLILAEMPSDPVVIDIGCGEGHFVRGLGEALEGKGRFIGFDLNAADETGGGIEFHQRYFDPLVDMAVFHPDAVVIRHVVEHLVEPSHFLEQGGGKIILLSIFRRSRGVGRNWIRFDRCVGVATSKNKHEQERQEQDSRQ